MQSASTRTLIPYMSSSTTKKSGFLVAACHASFDSSYVSRIGILPIGPTLPYRKRISSTPFLNVWNCCQVWSRSENGHTSRENFITGREETPRSERGTRSSFIRNSLALQSDYLSITAIITHYLGLTSLVFGCSHACDSQERSRLRLPNLPSNNLDEVDQTNVIRPPSSRSSAGKRRSEK
jgi:hypothetical protein